MAQKIGKNIIEYLLLALLVAFPLGQIGRMSFLNGTVNIIPLDLFVFLTVVTWLVLQTKNKTRLVPSKLQKPFLLFSGIGLLSLMLNSQNLNTQEFLVSSLYLIRFILYACIYFIVKDQSEKFKHTFFYGLIASGFGTVLVGLLQYFLYPDLRNLFYAGWDEHLYRVFSSFLDPNFVGALYVLTLLLIASVFFQNSFKKTWQKLGLSFLALSTFVALLLSYSRSSYLMLVVSMLFLFFLYNKRKLILAFLVILTFGVFFLPKDLQSEGVNLLRTASIDARSKEVLEISTIIKDNWLFGVGFNSLRFAKEDYGFLEERGIDVHSGAGTDNSFLFVLATTGIIGLTIYLFLWFNVFSLAKQALESKNAYRIAIGRVLLVSILGLFVQSFFVNSLFYPHILVWMWSLSGLTQSE